MGRAKLPDFEAERPPELGDLPIFGELASAEIDLPGGLAGRTLFKVELAFAQRSRSRLRVSCDALDQSGVLEAGIVMARGNIVRGGSWLLGVGKALNVLAADEDLLEVAVDGADQGPEHTQLALLRAAYHLGNRHVALQLNPGLIKLEYDYVLSDMLVGMGLKVRRRMGPFEPEWGAYASPHQH